MDRRGSRRKSSARKERAARAAADKPQSWFARWTRRLLVWGGALALLVALACRSAAPLLTPQPPGGFDGTLTLLSHADDPRELLVFEPPGSRTFIAAVAAVLPDANLAAPAQGLPPIQLTVFRWKRDRHAPVPLDDAGATPVVRIEVDVRFDV